MNAADFLWGYQRAVGQWRRLCAEARRMRELGARVNNSFSGIPAGQAGQNKVEAALEGVSEILGAADDAQVDIGARRAEVAAMIDRLPDARYRTILQLRYLNGYKWEQVAGEAGYTVRHALAIHAQALAFVQAELDKEPQK